jgi:hypothetical protein
MLPGDNLDLSDWLAACCRFCVCWQHVAVPRQSTTDEYRAYSPLPQPALPWHPNTCPSISRKLPGSFHMVYDRYWVLPAGGWEGHAWGRIGRAHAREQQRGSRATESSQSKAWPTLISSVTIVALTIVSWKFPISSSPSRSIEASRITPSHVVHQCGGWRRPNVDAE